MSAFTIIPRWTRSPVPGVREHDATIPDELVAALRRLADERRLESTAGAPRTLQELLHAWYRDGLVRIERGGKTR